MVFDHLTLSEGGGGAVLNFLVLAGGREVFFEFYDDS